MPATPTAAQSQASRQNGTRSTGPATEAGKARSALNSTRHGLSGRTFFLLADEDPAEFAAHEAGWLALWRPRDLAEQDAAELAIRALWRETRADRLEVQILSDLFGADAIEDEAQRQAAKAASFKALSTLLRYRAQIARENAAAMRDLDSLRRRRLDVQQPPRRSEPETPAERPPAAPQLPPAALAHPHMSAASKGAMASPPSEPEPHLNRHQRRALAARARHAA